MCQKFFRTYENLTVWKSFRRQEKLNLPPQNLKLLIIKSLISCGRWVWLKFLGTYKFFGKFLKSCESKNFRVSSSNSSSITEQKMKASASALLLFLFGFAVIDPGSKSASAPPI